LNQYIVIFAALQYMRNKGAVWLALIRGRQAPHHEPGGPAEEGLS
jgi:hypothetical protein